MHEDALKSTKELKGKDFRGKPLKVAIAKPRRKTFRPESYHPNPLVDHAQAPQGKPPGKKHQEPEKPEEPHDPKKDYMNQKLLEATEDPIQQSKPINLKPFEEKPKPAPKKFERSEVDEGQDYMNQPYKESTSPAKTTEHRPTQQKGKQHNPLREVGSCRRPPSLQIQSESQKI